MWSRMRKACPGAERESQRARQDGAKVGTTAAPNNPTCPCSSVSSVVEKTAGFETGSGQYSIAERFDHDDTDNTDVVDDAKSVSRCGSARAGIRGRNVSITHGPHPVCIRIANLQFLLGFMRLRSNAEGAENAEAAENERTQSIYVPTAVPSNCCWNQTS